MTMEPGVKLEVSDFKGIWYPAKVLEIDRDENEVLVHYDKWSSRFDEWIKCDSNRLRPTPEANVVKIEFKVGERVEAVWSTDGNRYPGVIQGVLPNDYYEILFEDGIKCKKKVSQIFKIQRITRRASAALQQQKMGKGVKSQVKQQPQQCTSFTSMGIDSLFPRRRSTTSLSSQDILAPPGIALPTFSYPCATSSFASRHSIFEPVADLGKRKRASHDYSLFLKVPKAPRKPRDPSDSPDGKAGPGPGRPRSRKIKTDDLEAPSNASTTSTEIKIEPELNIKVEPSDAVFLESSEVRTKIDVENHEGGGNLTCDGRSKRNRKSSMKAIENIAAECEKTPRKKGTSSRRSTLTTLEPSAPLETPPQPSASSTLQIVTGCTTPIVDSQPDGFVDADGNTVVIEQTSDGGWICPVEVEKCGKHFRKESLLQMHLKHYHPETNIQYRGRKLMNVVESAFARAAYVYEATVEKELFVPPLESTVPVTKGRRRSSPVTIATTPNVISPSLSGELGENESSLKKHHGSLEELQVDEGDDISLEDEDSSTDTASSSAEKSVEEISPTVDIVKVRPDKGKFRTKNVRIVLEKINLSKLQNNQVHSSPSKSSPRPRVSQRGRTLSRRRWNRRYSDNSDEDSLDEIEFLSSGDEADDDSDMSPVKSSRPKSKKGHYKHGDSSTHSHKTHRDKEIKTERVGSADENVQDDSLRSKTHANHDEEFNIDVNADGLLMSAVGKSRSRKSKGYHKGGRRSYNVPKGWSGRGRPPKSSRESSSRGDILSCYSRLQLKYIERQLYKNGQDRKVHFIPKSEDVNVDIINCECGHGEEFELMMQCELCQSWQHGSCYGIQDIQQMPEYYVCSFCRDPKRYHSAFSDEWSQEINKTGRLPRLSIAPRVRSSTEKKMKTCNDLMCRLEVVRDCLRSTQMKIELLNSPDNPKIYRWHKETTAPWEDVRQHQFNRHFRSVIRRLMRQNRDNPDYVSQLRSRIENYHKSKEMQESRTEEEHIQQLINKRLDARNWESLNGLKETGQIEDLDNDLLNHIQSDDEDDESSNSFGLKMPERITAESCGAHLHSDIVKQQAMLEFHLDTIEEKLKSLESSNYIEPSSAMRKVKDLEELKRKVQRINSNLSFMTKMKTVKEVEVPQKV